MKALLFLCSLFLLIAIANMPIGYYTFLRIVVTIGAVAVVIHDYENGLNFWVMTFGLIAILFNPIIPVYLHDQQIWRVIDFICALLFGIKGFKLNPTRE